MSLAKLNEFIRALLFGHTAYKIPKDEVIHQLVFDINTNVQEIIENGGLLSSITQDLENVITYLKEGNAHFHDGAKLPSLKLTSNIVKSFCNELSVLSRGNLDLGIVANSYQQQVEKDLKFLDTLVRKESVLKLPLQGLEKINIPNKMFQDVIILYDVKCKALGRIIDPFSLVLTSHDGFVDSIHWKSEKALKLFCSHFPKNALSIQIKNLLKSTVTSLLNADQESLDLLDNIEYKKFIQNINFINERVEKVELKHAPPKLIDLFHRLLALSKLDTLWIQEDIPIHKPEQDHFVYNLYFKNVELERENELLKALKRFKT